MVKVLKPLPLYEINVRGRMGGSIEKFKAVPSMLRQSALTCHS